MVNLTPLFSAPLSTAAAVACASLFSPCFTAFAAAILTARMTTPLLFPILLTARGYWHD